MTEEEERLLGRLAAIHHRVNWMADREAAAAWIRSEVSNGAFQPAKDALIAEAERILDKLEGKKAPYSDSD